MNKKRNRWIRKCSSDSPNISFNRVRRLVKKELSLNYPEHFIVFHLYRREKDSTLPQNTILCNLVCSSEDETQDANLLDTYKQHNEEGEVYIFVQLKDFELKSHKDPNISYFVLPNQLGSGGGGQVYEGRQTRNRKVTNQIAVKIVDTEMFKSGKMKDYLDAETDILSKVNHPNVIGWIETIQKNKIAYIITEFCLGGSLSSLTVPISEQDAGSILAQTLQALAYLSEQKIVHRDLKPANILLTSKNLEKAIVKLCDFGVSKNLRNSEENTFYSLIGTPAYSTPEKIRGKYDKSSEIASIGFIAYELLVSRDSLQHF